jgi:hypothetical protein
MNQIHLKTSIKIVLALIFSSTSFVNAAIYYSRASGNWNSTATWSTTAYGGAAAATTPGSGVGDVVLISGYTVTVTASPVNAIGSIVVTQSNNTGNDTKLLLNTSGITLRCNTFTVNDNNLGDDIDIEVAQGTLQVNGNAVFVRTTSNNQNENLRLYIRNTGRMNVTGNLSYSLNRAQNNQSAGNEIQIEDAGRLDVTGNFTVTVGNTNGNSSRFDLVMNNSAILNVGGNASFTVSNSDDGDDLHIDINGGAFSVTGTLTGTIAASATSGSSLHFYVDGSTVTTGALSFVQSGGGSGDMDIMLNASSTVSATTFTVNGSLTFTHNDGDNMELEINRNATLTILLDLSIDLFTSSDGDNVYLDINEGTLNAVNGNFTISGGASNSNFFYFNMDGDTAAFSGNIIFIQNGGGGTGDMNLHLNKNSTTNTALFTILGDLTFSHTGGDNYEIEVNNNTTLTVSGSLINTLESNDGDDFYIDINGGIFTVSQDFNHVQTTLGGTAEDLNIRIDGSGIFNVGNNVYIDHQVGGQVSIYTNSASGTTAEMNVGGDFTIYHAAAANSMYLDLRASSRFTTGGDFLIDNYAGGGDVARLTMATSATCTIGGNFTMNLLSGLTSQSDNVDIRLNGGNMTVGNNLTMYSLLGNDAIIIVEGNGTSLTVVGTLTLQNAGGDVNYMTVGNSTGSPTINVGALTLIEAGGARTYSRLYRSSIMNVTGNISLSATAASTVDIGVYSTSQLRIGGDFIRAAVPSRFGVLSCSATSTIEYNGSVQQTIAGNAGSGGDGFTYGNVVLTNDDGFIMTATEGNATIPNLSTLTFNNGIVYSSSSAFFIIANGGAVSGASNLSYVDGPIRKVGSSAFTFPIGDNGNYQPASISAPSNAAHHFTAQYFAANPSPTYDATALEAGLDHISKCEYWYIDRTSGASNVTVTLAFDAGSCGVTDLNALRIARWDGTQWVNQGNGGTTGSTSAGTITNGVAIAGYLAPNSPFTLASLNSTNPLPVELLNFDAVVLNSNVKLDWTTLSEKNNDFFEIERTSDGINFSNIGKVKGAGNSNSSLNYFWIDEKPLTKISYYRLKQTDFDGSYKYSELKKVSFESENEVKNDIIVYPNPFSGYSLSIALSNQENFIIDSEDVSIAIYDELGRVILEKRTTLLSSDDLIDVSFSDKLNAGTYILKTRIGTREFNKLIVVN